MRRCAMPPRKCAVELCRTLLAVQDSPMSPLPHKRGPLVETPPHTIGGNPFKVSYYIHSNTYETVSEKRCTSCMVCGRSVHAIKMEKVNTYMRQSTPANEPEAVTNLRREAYLNGLNAGILLFITPAVSQAAACDGIKYTMSADNQEIVPETLELFTFSIKKPIFNILQVAIFIC